MMNPIGQKQKHDQGLQVITLPETNMLAPENWCLEDDPFLFGAYFQVFLLLVSGRVPLSESLLGCPRKPING